jgi:hypothetical protein
LTDEREDTRNAGADTHAAFILRLLLDDGGARGAEGAGGPGWEGLLRTARRNVVLVRVADRLAAAGADVPEFFAEAARRERRRSRAVVELVGRVGRACERHGVEFIFAKAFQHYPDVGGDVDLFVTSRSTEVDALILEGMGAAPARRDLLSRMAGATSYRVPGCDAVLDIHHGRMGLLGEYGSHVNLLIRNGERMRVEGAEFLAPSAEDVLVVQGMQRVSRHSHIRLCDIVSTVKLLRRDRLDWNYVTRVSAQLGTEYGLRCYLSYVEQIHRSAFGRELLAPGLARELKLGAGGRVEFREGFYRFSRVRVAGRVYLDTVRAAVRTGNWDAASRLCMMPLATAAAAFKRLG